VKSVVNVVFFVQVPPVVLIVTPDREIVVATHFPAVKLSDAAGTVDILQCVKPVAFSPNAPLFSPTAVITKFVFVCLTKIFHVAGNALRACVPFFVIVICWVIAHCVATIVHKIGPIIATPSPPIRAIPVTVSCWFVVAPVVVTPSVVSPLAGTSRAVPTQRARMNTRDFMMFPFDTPIWSNRADEGRLYLP
jgi:hypothetical protein